MEDRRRFPRYDVVGCPELKGELLTGGLKSRLIMMALGGCGFYGDPMSVMLQSGAPVESAFQLIPLQPTPVKVKGFLRYARAIQLGKTTEIFYGIEFAPDQEEILGPIIEHLEKLERKGIVKLSA